MKSESSSGQPRANQHLSRKRTLKRGCHYEPLNETHFRYLYAFYKLGELPFVPPDLDTMGFALWIAQYRAGVIDAGGEIFMLSRQDIPLGMTKVNVAWPDGARRQLYPHTLWFKKSTPRNRLECLLKLLIDIKREGMVMVVADAPNWKFFNHLCKYGVIRTIGKLRGYYQDGQDAMIYQGVS